MSMSADQLADLEVELRAVLTSKGSAPADADEIIDTAFSAAQKGIASMVEVAGAAQSHNRDRVIILALHIMERLALSPDHQFEADRLPGQAGNATA